MIQIHQIVGAASVSPTVLAHSLASPKTPTFNFSQELERVRQQAAESKTDPYIELVTLQEKIIGAKQLSSQELLYYQIRASQFGMRVELLSKVGESALATVRKFQQQGA